MLVKQLVLKSDRYASLGNNVNLLTPSHLNVCVVLFLP